MKESFEKVPVWALAYLVSGDSRGYMPQEVQVVDDFCKRRHIKHIYPLAEDDEGDWTPYYTDTPLFGGPTEVVDCIVIYGE